MNNTFSFSNAPYSDNIYPSLDPAGAAPQPNQPNLNIMEQGFPQFNFMSPKLQAMYANLTGFFLLKFLFLFFNSLIKTNLKI